MADLLSQLVQALRNGGLSKPPAAASAAPASGATAGLAAPNAGAPGTGSLPPLSNPQLLAVMAVARDQLLMTIGRQQLTLTPQQLPAAGQPLQLGQHVLVQQTANQLHTMLWQQVTSQLQQLQQASRPLPALQQAVQLQPPAGNPAQLIMSGAASSNPSWQLNLSQLAPNLTRQLLASAPSAAASTAPAQLTLRLLPVTGGAPSSAPQVQLQLARPGQAPLQAEVPLAKLPPALIVKLIGTPMRTTPVTPLNQPVTANQPAPTAAAPLLTPAAPQNPTRALLPLQGNQLAPTELRQVIQQLASQLATAATQPATNTAVAPSATASATPQTPAATLQNLLQAVVSQLPQGADFTRSEALQQWVSQWFAARPVSLNPQQSMAGIGQLLLLALGAKLGQTTGQPPATTAAANNFTQNLAQWLQGQPPGPATPAAAAAAAANPATATALSFANLPAATLQQLLQVLSGGLNSARFSQAILTESSRVGAPDYHILLPMGTGAQHKDAEVLIQRRLHDKKRKAEAAEDQWLFKLKMELSQYGPVLVKGKYQQSGTSIVFITENIGARVHIQERLKFLQARLDQLQVAKVELSAIRGKVPRTLRKPGENSIHIQV
ncbi:MAG: hypothetical protein WEA82_07550 [Idiomarina sp.]